MFTHLILPDGTTPTRQMTVPCRGRDLEALCDLFHRNIGIVQQGLGRCQVFVREHRRPSPSPPSGRVQSGVGALPDDGTLEFGEAPKDVKHQLAAGCVVIDRFLDG